MEVKRMYWIVHPAYVVADRSTRFGHTASDLSSFIREKIYPVVERAASDPRALLVYVKSSPAAVSGRGQSASRFRKRAAIEAELEQYVASTFAGSGRAIVVCGDKRKAIAEAVRQTVSNGHVIPSSAKFISHGSLREYCVAEYPFNFAEKFGFSPNLYVSAEASISGHDAVEKAMRRRRGKPL